MDGTGDQVLDLARHEFMAMTQFVTERTRRPRSVYEIADREGPNAHSDIHRTLATWAAGMAGRLLRRRASNLKNPALAWNEACRRKRHALRLAPSSAVGLPPMKRVFKPQPRGR